MPENKKRKRTPREKIISEQEEEYSRNDTEARDYYPVRSSRSGRIGCLGGIMYGAFVICVSIILACVAWMFASDVLALNKDPITAEVTIPKEFDIDDVATSLNDAGIVEYKFLFKLYSRFSHAEEKIDPGTYVLTTDYDYFALVKKMSVGSESQIQTKVTFPEGFTMEEIFTRLEENDICSKEDLYEAAANYNYSYAFLDGLETGDASRLEGFLFPDTYYFYQGQQASSAINKLLLTFHYKLTADMWTQAENLGLSMQQVMTVASMIEKEAANDDERATIASVIYNRLAAGMPLQIDATIQYALPERKAQLSTEDLAIDSPYNTYLNTGLPPTPIANPGMASINAALKPASTKYYFYALDSSTGTHKFFKNYSEFEAFVASQDYSN